jgi:hypothetical protein
MTDTSSSRLQVLFDAALQSYEKQTGMRLADHPLARQLDNCYSVDSIMDILQQQARAFTKFRRDEYKFMTSLKRAVHVLHALSSCTSLGEGVGLVCRMPILAIPSCLYMLYSRSPLRSQYSQHSLSYSPSVPPSS